MNAAQYIQHNPETGEGSEGLTALFKRLSKTGPKVNIVRVFEDGNYLFAHTEYNFASRRIGFEVFRFKNGQAVEHWDNIQQRLGPNPSSCSMMDGPVEVADIHLTESNRAHVRSFVETVLIGGALDALEDYIRQTHYAEHNLGLADGAASVEAALAPAADGSCHRASYRCRRSQYCFILTTRPSARPGPLEIVAA